MSRPDRLDSPVIAPTRSCGRMPAARPAPTNSRTAAPWTRRAGRPAGPREGPAGRADAGSGRTCGMSCSSGSAPVPSCVSLTAASATSMRSNSSASASTTPRNRSRSPSSSASRSEARVSSSRRARRSATVGQRLGGDLLSGDALDGLEHPVLARLGERDRHALAAGPPDPADPVHVRLRRRRHVVVHDVGEVVDVEAAGRHVGRHQQVGRRRPQPAHDLVALLLAQPAVQRLGPVAAAVERVGERVDLLAGPAEHDRRCRLLHVEHPPERGRLVRAGDDVRRSAGRAGPARRRGPRGRWRCGPGR